MGWGAEPEGREFGKDVFREFGLLPPLAGVGGDLGGKECPEFVEFPLFLNTEQRFEVEEVGGGQLGHG